MATKKKTSDRLAEIKKLLRSRRKSLSEPRATTGLSGIGRLIQKAGLSSRQQKQLSAAEALERRFPLGSAARYNELVGDTSNALTISLPSRGSSRGSPKGSKSGRYPSRRPRGSGDEKKEKSNG